MRVAPARPAIDSSLAVNAASWRRVEQVVAHPLQAADLLARALEELRARGRVDLAVELEVGEGPQRGDRRAQLVADVGDELAKPVAVGADEREGPLELIGHGVELASQRVDLGDLGGLHALGEVALRDAGRCLLEPGEGPRQAARCPGPGEHGNDEGRDAGRDEGEADALERLDA